VAGFEPPGDKSSKGGNPLLVKTNNRLKRERHLWALHCAVDSSERRAHESPMALNDIE
jgi:hypothetical protein